MYISTRLLEAYSFNIYHILSVDRASARVWKYRDSEVTEPSSQEFLSQTSFKVMSGKISEKGVLEAT